MSKQNAIKAISNYKDFYTATFKQIATLKADKDHTDSWKQPKVEKIMKDFFNQNDLYKSAVKEAIAELAKATDTKRQENIKRGLESAESINMVVNGIKSNSYSVETLNDLIAVYNDNPVALQSLRGALLASNSEDMKTVGASIPQNSDDRVKMNLDRIVNNLTDIPSPTADAKQDFNVGLLQNGTTFDQWISYIDGHFDE
jgi:hypothetical protein